MDLQPRCKLSSMNLLSSREKNQSNLTVQFSKLIIQQVVLSRQINCFNNQNNLLGDENTSSPIDYYRASQNGSTLFHLRLNPWALYRQPLHQLDHKAIGSPNATSPYSQTSDGYNFTITWRKTLPGVISSGITPFNFETAPYSFLNYIAELSQIDTTEAILTFQPKNCNITFLHFTIIIVTEDLPNIELLPILWSNVTFPSSNYPQVQLTINLHKLPLNASSTAQYYCLRQWTNVINFIHSNSGLFISNLYCQRENSLIPFPLKLSIDGDLYNSYTEYSLYEFQIKILVFVIDTMPTNYNLISLLKYYYFRKGSFTTNNLGISSDFGPQTQQSRCIIGLTAQHSLYQTTTQKTFIIFLYNAQNISHLSTSNYQRLYYRVLCFGKCPPSTFKKLQTSTICQNCNDYIPTCLTCLNSTFCTTCISGFVVKSSVEGCVRCIDEIEYCAVCSSLSTCLNCIVGNSVLGGCTNVVGCTQVMQMKFVQGVKAMCVRCDQTEFQLIDTQFLCICKNNKKFVGYYCTEVIGCTGTRKLANNSVICTSCNPYLHFVHDSRTNTCFCDQHYELKNTTCNDKCGDGFVITSQCDDGNLDNGDGCSSSCTQETNYKCYQYNQSSPSICRYLGRIKVTLISTNRAQTINQGKFIFSFQPKLASLSKVNLGQYFTFLCSDASFSIHNWAYDDGKIFLQVNFETDLEDRDASVNFSFNQLYVYHNPIIFNFTIKSDGQALLVFKPTTFTALLNYMNLASIFLAFLVLLVGSWFHKMAGVQVMSLIQMIYYSHFAVSEYSPIWSLFQSLSPAGASDVFLQKQQASVLVFQQYQIIPYSMTKSQLSLLFISILPISATILYGILLVILHLTQSKASTFSVLVKRCYNCVIFPFTLASIVPFYFIASNFCYNQSREENIFSIKVRSLLSNCFVVLASMMFSYQFHSFMRHHKEIEAQSFMKNIKRCYIPSFQVYLQIQLILLHLWVQSGKQICFYIIFGLNCLIVPLLITNKPYNLLSENVRIFLILLTALVYGCLLILKEKSNIISSEQMHLNICFILSVLIFACVVFSTVVVTMKAIKQIKSCRLQINQHPETVQHETLLQKNQRNILQQFQNMSMNSYKRIQRPKQEDNELRLIKQLKRHQFRRFKESFRNKKVQGKVQEQREEQQDI